MPFSISSKNDEKTFKYEPVIYISSKPGFDYYLNTGFDFTLTVQYDAKTNKCALLNQFNTKNFLFKGQPIPPKLEIDKVCKIMIEGSDEFITIKILDNIEQNEISQPKTSEREIHAIYGNNINATAKLSIEKKKNEIETARVAIIKQVGGEINDIKRKISMNSKAGILLHIALFLASFVCAFGIANYMTGLPLQESGGVIEMPSNLKLIFIYAIILYGINTILKQGMFLYLQNRLGYNNHASYAAERIMIVLATIFFVVM